MVHVISLFSLLNDDFKTEKADIIFVPSLYGGVMHPLDLSGVNYMPILIIGNYSEI